MWIRVFITIFVSQRVYGQLNFLGEFPLTDQLIKVIKSDKKCTPSLTTYTNGMNPCKGALIFEDDFTDTFVSKSKWMVERYTPVINGAPDYEFVSYERNDDTLFLKDKTLIITPVPANDENEVKGILDLREGCTSIVPDQCFVQQVGASILPPVKSSKVSTKFSFTYGKVEVKAKLPMGDWLYTQIQLLPRIKTRLGGKMWVAYTRGNSYYIGPSGDVGSTVLFGGLVMGSTEPDRSRHTSRRKSVVPYGEDTHTYTLIWQPGNITALVDNVTYGTYLIDQTENRFDEFANEFYLSIGVGVGGINDFPDNYTSNNPKPWLNTESKQLKSFFDARSTWIPTWKARNTHQLQVDSVKIWAL